MIKKINKVVLASLVACSFFMTRVGYASEAPAFVQFVRPLGMGGAFTAVADDQNIFSFNPAGMVQRTGGQLTILEIALGASKDLKDFSDFVTDNKEDLNNIDTSPRRDELLREIQTNISNLRPRVYVAADVASYVSGPRFLGMPIHVGFGALAVVDAQFHMDIGAANIPNISYAVNSDLVLPLSIAHRWEAPWKIPGKIGVGLTGKIIRRATIHQERLSVIGLEDYDAPPLTTGHGFGSDLGLLYQPTERTNIGLMVQDFLGTKMKFDALVAEKGYPAQAARESVIHPRTNVGVAIVPKKLLWLLPTSDRWTFSADVRDIFIKDEHVLFEDGFKHIIGDNFATHFYAGAEFRYWFLRFRGGAYQGYPTLGLGLDIPVIKVDYAFYSRELGFHAGDQREQNHVISLALRFGSGYTESRERIKKSKQSKRMKADSVPETEPVGAVPEKVEVKEKGNVVSPTKTEEKPVMEEVIPK